MNIAVIGSGTVGKTLAKGFKEHGHQVTISSRDGESVADWAKENGIAYASFSNIASHGDVLVLAVKGGHALKALEMISKSDMVGKTVIDTTNPISAAPPVNGVLNYSTNINYSMMEEFQAEYPEVNFVKSFNSIGAAFMVNPDFGGVKPTMFICGNNENAKNTVSILLGEFGFEVEDCGSVEAARAIEPLCMLWCIPGFRENKWSHAFKLLKK